MAILGLLSTESFAAERFKSVRRSVFYQYPNGAAPLLGLLSMLDGEVLNDPEFSWYEDRYKQKVQYTVVNGTTSGPWYADSSGALGAAAATTAATKTAGTAYWLRVDGRDNLRPNDVLKVKNMTITGGTIDLQLKILASASGIWYDDTGGFFIRVTPLNTTAAVTNIHTSSDNLEVQVLGNANFQGQVGSSEGSYTIPTTTGNATMIFRTPYSFTGTAMKTALKFDESGPYKDRAKKASIGHMIQMELQFLFGEYSKYVDTSTGLPCFTTGGILFFMRLWEAGEGNALGGKTSTYPVAASTSNSDDNKRIININGNISESSLDDYYERLFRKTNNISNEKMAFVGSGFLNVMNKLYKSSMTLNSDLPTGDTYGMNVVKHQTPFGVVFYKTHPLFSENASMRYNALFLDVQNLHYRYMQDRDTNVKKNIQPNNADYRQDEWFTEAGFEMQFPESHMYMVGVTGTSA
jgi:hypothetical protein